MFIDCTVIRYCTVVYSSSTTYRYYCTFTVASIMDREGREVTVPVQLWSTTDREALDIGILHLAGYCTVQYSSQLANCRYCSTVSYCIRLHRYTPRRVVVHNFVLDDLVLFESAPKGALASSTP